MIYVQNRLFSYHIVSILKGCVEQYSAQVMLKLYFNFSQASQCYEETQLLNGNHDFNFQKGHLKSILIYVSILYLDCIDININVCIIQF